MENFAQAWIGNDAAAVSYHPSKAVQGLVYGNGIGHAVGRVLEAFQSGSTSPAYH